MSGLIRAVLIWLGLWPPPWWPFPWRKPPTKIAVAAYMGAKPGVLDWNGQPMDWAWVLRQWDRIASAGRAVRAVVVDSSYVGLTGTQLNEITGKLNACRRAGQLVCGYVFGSGGAIPLGPAGSLWNIPRGPNDDGPLIAAVTQAMAPGPHIFQCIQDQIAGWRNTYPNSIDGIYVDVGPMDCLAPGTPGGQANVPANYSQYCQYIRQIGYQTVFLLTPQYDDQDPNQPGWLRALQWNFLGLWEEAVPPYRTSFNAWNVCANSFTHWPPGNPDASWWDPVRVGRSVSERATRVHIINKGARVHVRSPWWLPSSLQKLADRIATIANLYNLMQLANTRGCTTVWITETSVSGSYDQLPPYWDDEVALCS